MKLEFATSRSPLWAGGLKALQQSCAMLFRSQRFVWPSWGQCNVSCEEERQLQPVNMLPISATARRICKIHRAASEGRSSLLMWLAVKRLIVPQLSRTCSQQKSTLIWVVLRTGQSLSGPIKVSARGRFWHLLEGYPLDLTSLIAVQSAFCRAFVEAENHTSADPESVF